MHETAARMHAAVSVQTFDRENNNWLGLARVFYNGLVRNPFVYIEHDTAKPSQLFFNVLIIGGTQVDCRCV